MSSDCLDTLTQHKPQKLFLIRTLNQNTLKHLRLKEKWKRGEELCTKVCFVCVPSHLNLLPTLSLNVFWDACQAPTFTLSRPISSATRNLSATYNPIRVNMGKHRFNDENFISGWTDFDTRPTRARQKSKRLCIGSLHSTSCWLLFCFMFQRFSSDCLFVCYCQTSSTYSSISFVGPPAGATQFSLNPLYFWGLDVKLKLSDDVCCSVLSKLLEMYELWRFTDGWNCFWVKRIKVWLQGLQTFSRNTIDTSNVSLFSKYSQKIMTCICFRNKTSNKWVRRIRPIQPN